MRAKRLFENPDTCCRSGRYDNYSECEDSYEYALKYYDDDSHAFGYYSGMMVFGPEGVFHPVLAVGGRQDFKYAGRIWLKQKIISFWDYPQPNKILQTLKDLEEAFANATCLYLDQIKKPYDLVGSEGDQDLYYNKPREINILKDRDYRIEVMKGTPEQKKFGKKDWPTEVGDTEFITLNTYALRKNVHDRSEEEFRMRHGKSPLKKKKQPVPAGTGSRRYGEKKPLEQRHREMTSEGIDFKRGQDPSRALSIGMDDDDWIRETRRRLKEDLGINVYRDDYVHEESGMIGSFLFFYDKGLTLEYFDHEWFLHFSKNDAGSMPIWKSDNLDEAIKKTKKFVEIYKSEENNKKLIQKMQKQRWDYDSQNLPPT